MPRHSVLGYCPRLLQAVQSVSWQELPHIPDDEPNYSRSFANEDLRRQFREYIVDCLIGSVEMEGDHDEYLDQLYEAIDDDDLKALVEFGLLDKLVLNDRGYFLAIQNR